MVKRNGDWFEVDYRNLTVGAPAGQTRVICCSKCGKSGIRWRGTKTVAHRVLYLRTPMTNKERVQVEDACKGALPKAPPQRRAEESGLSVVPKGVALT
jgi:hypothetical protein